MFLNNNFDIIYIDENRTVRGIFKLVQENIF